ncbi:MAG TPA: hypothetical protein VMW82_00700 [Candidatus Paceibacterota bacterium]|nr:hypothetical protein [Candidatus Paceibacterota bacterium]
MTEKIIKSETKINNILFWICFCITLLTILMTLLDFFSNGEYPPTNISLFYIGILIIYSIHKEAIRFLEHAAPERRSRKGELFVYFWIIMTTLLYLINFLTKNQFSYSGLMTATYLTLEVGAVFVLARVLKLIMVKVFEKNGK